MESDSMEGAYILLERILLKVFQSDWKVEVDGGLTM